MEHKRNNDATSEKRKELHFLTTQPALFDLEALPISVASATNPSGYKGLSAFHKYWGKKPIEPLLLLIERLSEEGDIIFDPFLGGGLLARATVSKRRRFIGVDINPCAIELGKLFLNLPYPEEFAEAFTYLDSTVAPQINSSYSRSDGSIASHYLWDDNDLIKVWKKNGKTRIGYLPEQFDIEKTHTFNGYTSKHVRPLTLFQNSRINAREGMDITDLFTGRALRNIDILLENILLMPEKLRRAFLLTLTSSSGQMSNMVFAVSKRGKTTGKNSSGRIEVGSWAIGFWCPRQHFEINCWNCFSHRATRFIKTLREQSSIKQTTLTDDLQEFYKKEISVALCLGNALDVMDKIMPNSVSLIVTDPPHSDRVPYLELSDFWNAILQYPTSRFSEEIVISNAKGREKNTDSYVNSMRTVMKQAERILKPNGTLCVQFNAKDGNSWEFLYAPPEGLLYVGCFPLEYSARSLVQDNRKGAMKNDYTLIYKKTKRANQPCVLEDIQGWSTGFPKGES